MLRDQRYKYVHFGDDQRWPPLLFNMAAGGGAELANLAAEPGSAAVALEYAQKMLSWRMRNAESVANTERARSRRRSHRPSLRALRPPGR